MHADEMNRRPLDRPRLQGARTVPVIPARFRLRNAPTNFVGRDRACDWLERSIREAPVSVVWGLGGLGKTSLVLQTLHRRFPREAERAVMVGLRESAVPEHAHVEILRAVAAFAGVAVDWSTLNADPEGILATAIDITDELDHWVVLDDLHHVGADVADDILRQLAASARKSRWIATSRVRPSVPEIVGQVHALSAMGASELSALAESCAPHLDEAARQLAVEGASGSPWSLRRALAGISDRRVSPDDIAGPLDADSATLISALRVVHSPIPRKVLAALADVSDERVDALERQGLIEREGDSLRLHDVARDLLSPESDVEGIRLEVAEALERHHGPSETLAAVRLYREIEPKIAARLLSERGASLVAAGYVLELWQLLETMDDPSLARLRMRTAVAIGDPSAATNLSPPEDASIEDRMMWGAVCAVRWDPKAMFEAAEAAFEEALAAGPIALAIPAALGAMQAAAFLDSPKLASIVERALALPCDGGLRVARDALVGVGQVYLGEYGAAQRAGDAVERALPTVPPELRRHAVEAMLAIPRNLRRVHDAERVLAVDVRENGAGPLSLDMPRGLAVSRITLAMARGDVAEVRRLRAWIAPWIERPSIRRVVALRAVISSRIDAGELLGLEGEIRAFIAEAEAHRDVFATSSANLALIELARLQARPVGEMELPEARVAQHGMFRDLRELHRLAAFARRGEVSSEHTAEVLTRFDIGCEARCLATLAHAQALVAEGDVLRGKQAIWNAIQAIEEIGYRRLLPEARAIQCEALFIAGDFGELRGAIRALEELAASMPSERFAAEARFFAHVREDVSDPALLEEWALLLDVSPTVARRARALLGGGRALDAIDRRFLDVHRARTRWSTTAIVAPKHEWRSGWGLDGARNRVWIAGREPVDLSESALAWRCLETMAAAAPGEATVEQIVAALWPDEVYHPFKHKPRIHPLIKKLRNLLEDDPASPLRLVTTENGYAFGDRMPVRWLRSMR